MNDEYFEEEEEFSVPTQIPKWNSLKIELPPRLYDAIKELSEESDHSINSKIVSLLWRAIELEGYDVRAMHKLYPSWKKVNFRTNKK